jgi:hypothetical protein
VIGRIAYINDPEVKDARVGRLVLKKVGKQVHKKGWVLKTIILNE